ncbi:MAG TPA: Smr/MutS family protein [Acetobacteraceae bacterium]|jgi:DNA-nicking Smr family endonuclease|nr:Smr/MutS family protein [Acetobacteraceae bacterium]
MSMPRRTDLTEADRALWASFTSRIRPLPGRNPPALPALPDVATASGRHRPAPALRATHTPSPPLAIGAQPGGLDSARWHRFRIGKLRPTRTLDLHGHTAQRAFQALGAFLRSAHAEGLRCVEVVTGQGGILRHELPHWLNRPEFRSMILAAAHPHAANPGSVRLLLRRPR